MLPRLDAALPPVTPADGAGGGAAVGDSRQAAFQRALQNLVGQTVSAEVMSKMKDGSYLVKVADNTVRMTLPGDTQIGSNVSLTVLSAQPRPTFQLGNTTLGATPTVVTADGSAAEGGEPATTLPSQGAAVYVPGGGKPATGATPAPPGLPAGAANAGQAAGAAPEGDPAPATNLPAAGGIPGQAKPGAGAANTPATATPARPGLPAGAADLPDAAPAPATAGRPAIAGGAVPNPALAGGATPNPAAALATPGQGAAVLTQPQAQAAAALAAGTAGGAAPADGVKPQSLAATLLGKAPLTPSSELPDLNASTPQPTLSSAARALTTLLSTAQAGQAGQLALIGKTALFGNAAPDTADLAHKLQDSISKSGLFYESHVAEWVKGDRPLADLMREPQMQRLMQQGAETARAATNGPDLSAAQMVNQQLHTQEQNRVLWNGQAWPGQQMQWEVQRDQREGGRGGEADEQAEPIWRSGVRFRLPLLGAVSAAVTLIGDQVHIQVQTDSDGSATTLRAWAGQLESAMAAAGAQLSSLTISQEDGDAG